MNNTKKRIFMCSFHQESNCFNPVLTPLDMFDITDGDKVSEIISRRCYAAGIVNTLEEDESVEAIYSTVMRAPSGAPLQQSVVEYFLSHALPDLKNAGMIDGVVMALHGATMSECSDDVCGDIVEIVREIVGQNVPISCAFDLHANITEKIMKNADYVAGYLEYPHTDQYETGVRAAKLLLSHLNGKRGVSVMASVPMIAPAHAYTTKSGELLELVNKAKAKVEAGEIFDYTIFQVQPWLDTDCMTSAVVVVAETEEKAKAAADELVFDNFNLRKILLGEKPLDVSKVIEKALLNKSGKPIVLVDSSDSRGAGSTSDSAAVIEELLPYRDVLKCAVSVSDAPAVEKAFAAGVGAVCDFTLGATVAPELSSPVLVKDALVVSLHEGHFTHHGPIRRGEESFCGKVAVLRAGKILIQVSSESRSEEELGFYRGFGIEPTLCDIVSVKACNSFRAGYEPIAEAIYNTSTPGAAGTVLTALPFKHRPVPMYPFEEISEKDVKSSQRYR